GVGRHLRHVGLEVVAVILEIGEEHVVVVKDGIVANVALRDHVENFGPHVGVDLRVLLEALRLDADDLSVAFHPAAPSGISSRYTLTAVSPRMASCASWL